MRKLHLPTSILLIGLLCSCSKPDAETTKAATDNSAQSEPGTVTIPPNSPMLQEIRVETVKSGSVPADEVVSPGKVEANPNHVSHIVLPVAGRVTNVLVKIGDSVTKGQPLLMIESPDADAAMSTYLQAQAGVMQSKANIAKAQADRDRNKDLYEHEAAAKKDVEAADNALVQAKAADEQAAAALEQAQARMTMLGLNPKDFKHTVTVSAPLSGKVLELTITPGEYRNDLSQPVMTIADLSTVWVSAEVPEVSIRMIKVGEPIQITLVAYPGETFTGKVSRIADTVNPQTRTVKVQAEIPNPQERFRPEMFGDIHQSEGTTMLPVIPSAAVVQGNGKSFVFVQTAPGHFQQVEVTGGRPMGDRMPITSGLKADDKVVVDGVMLLKGMSRSNS